jgi:hypothetical protein
MNGSAQKMETLVLLLKGALEARHKVGLKMNVPSDKLAEVVDVPAFAALAHGVEARQPRNGSPWKRSLTKPPCAQSSRGSSRWGPRVSWNTL